MIRAGWIVLAALALALAACAQPDSGMAGCFEQMPDGRKVPRPDWAPNSRGMCPTRTEMLAAQEYAATARTIECTTACKLGLLMLMGLR